MKIANINPHIRFAEQIIRNAKKNTVYVKDCRIFYIIEGTAEVILHEQSVFLKKNSVFYCSGDTSYTISNDEPLNLLTLNFDLSQRSNSLTMPFTPEETENVKSRIPTDKCDIEDSSFLNSFLFFESCPEFKGIITDIIKEYATQKILFKENCSAMLKKLLIELHRKELGGINNSSETVNKVIDYISSNYTEEIKNSKLAAMTGYHEYYLNRLFMKHTGTGMHKYIINMRLNEAKRLLINTAMPISLIGTNVGFNNNTHFSRYFKRETDMTPSVYRINFKNKI